MRSIDEVGRGDYVQVGGTWKRIASITPGGRLKNDHTIVTTDGSTYTMIDIWEYAKASDPR